MADVSIYSTLATHILQGQLAMIGPLAINQAKAVEGISVDEDNKITIKGNGKDILGGLVKQFELLFGNASIEACKDAVKEASVTISDKDLPDILK
jgi:hypothetical protein